jgi:hypothetical protein
MISFSDEVSGLRKLRQLGAGRRCMQGARFEARARGAADLVGDEFGVLAHPGLDRDLRLGDEVHRAEFQRAHGDLGAALGQRGHHQHRHRAQAHQFFEEVEAVHLRHLDVEREDVGIDPLDQVACDERIGRHADDFHVRLRVDDLGHHAADQGRIVDDGHFDLVRGVHSVPFRQNRSMAPPTGATFRRLA